MRHPFSAPALAYRMNVALSPDIDTRKSDIFVYSDLQSGRCVKTVHPYDENKNYEAFYKASEEVAERLWMERFGVIIPWDTVDGGWAANMKADYLLGLGSTLLADQEIAVLKMVGAVSDLTLDMRWLVIEGLGWRPGVPVPENDLGWIALWAEEQTCGGYIAIVRDLLGMPEMPFDWVPPAVVALSQT